MCTVSQDEWPNELVVNTASTGSSLPESTMSVIHVRVGLGCVRVCVGGALSQTIRLRPATVCTKNKVVVGFWGLLMG